MTLEGTRFRRVRNSRNPSGPPTGRVSVDAPSPPFELRRSGYDSPDARCLVGELHREQTASYGFADHPRETSAAAFGRGAFLVGYLNGQAVACGGVRIRAGGVGEIKKMYVRPGLRGHGIGAQVLAALEDAARLAGARRVVLESGVRNTAALALYVASGYAPIPPYVAGRNPHINRAFAKDL